jgi:hypothetical protein
MQSSTTSDNSPPAPHYYRLGIVGSKDSGKTCVITSLKMLRDPNPAGFTAHFQQQSDEENAALTRGLEWIQKAEAAFKKGEWPEPNREDDEHKAIRFRFGDGQTREKYAEVFDYSGELLNPLLSAKERAVKLRDLLGQMDGLLVIAEHPFSSHDIGKVEENLNGLMQAFTLLVNKKMTLQKSAQAPIALIVNKWDRSEFFDGQADSASQTRLLESKYLKTSPPPYHVAVANTLRSAAPSGHFKMFAVSAMGLVERAGDKELPPKGKLHSMGMEDPFLWLIGQIDLLEIASLESLLRAKWNWVTPWPTERREIARLKGRIAKRTPERPALNRLSRKSWVQFACGLFIWVGVVPAINDGWRHHRAETAINYPKGDWQAGTQWLRDYSNSSPLNHVVYKWHFSVSEAAERARQETEKKDNDAFAALPKLSPDKPGLLDEAETLAKDQLATFPNSHHSDERKSVMEKVRRIRHELDFEKELSQWRQEHDKAVSDRAKTEHDKLADIQSLEKKISNSPTVPLDGALRDQWSALLLDIEKLRKQLGTKITTGEGLDKIRQALDAEDYLKAADLLSDWSQQQDAGYKELLNRFQTNIAAKVVQQAETTSQQGAKWSDAVVETDLFLDPARRVLLTDANTDAIQKIILRVKMKGDEYFYETARNTRDTATLSTYLNQAPLQTMSNEVSKYRDWLDEREKPRKIIFRLTKIKWNGIDPKGWTDGTKIKLFVNGSGDSRNSADTGNARTGESSDASGIRSVTLENTRQIDEVPLVYQVWNVWWGDKELINKRVTFSPEKFLDQTTHPDGIGGAFSIEVEGVLPKPDLPSWHQ